MGHPDGASRALMVQGSPERMRTVHNHAPTIRNPGIRVDATLQ